MRRPANDRSRSAYLFSALCAAVFLAGCATQGTPRSAETLYRVDHETMKRLREEMVAESKKLAEAQDGLQKEIAPPRQAVTLPMAAPAFDPLEAKTINVSMMGASVSQLLAAIADQAGLNLVVEPEVLALDKRADMHLKKVSLRETINEVMRAFDLAAEIKGNTLRVNLMGERIFSLDLLNAVMSLDVSSGGNVFGANTAGGGSGGSSNALRGNVVLAGNIGSKTDPYEQVEQAVKRILGEADGPRKPAAVEENEKDDKLRPVYSLNRISGSLYVRARPSQIQSIDKMIERTQKILRRQVHIEAQLIDVQLNDGFELGVDWNLLRRNAASNFGVSPSTLGSAAGTLPQPGGDLPGRVLSIPAQLIGSQNGPSFGLAYQSGSFSAILSALRSFGNVKVLSNPNVQVRNGTPALLSVGTNSRYVSKSSVTVSNPGGGASTTSSDVQTDSVFAGVMVGVVPFVRDDGRIELMVHPMQTDVDSASLQLIDVGNGNRISLPVVSYKGMTTTLNVSDGDTVLIGGLIDQRTSDNDSGAPVASDIPIFGALFSNKRNMHASRELVMVLRVKVL